MSRKNGRLKSRAETSLFLNLLGKLSEFFHSKICTSKTAQGLNSYDDLNSLVSDSFFFKGLSYIKPRKKTVIGAKNKISGSFENSFFHRLLHRIADVILGTKLRIYGVIFFIFGVLSALVGVIERYLVTPPIENTTLMWQGLTFIAFSVPLLISKDTLCESLVNGRLSSRVLHFLGYKSEDILRPDANEILAVPVITGVLLGVLSIAVQPVLLLLVVLAIVYLSVVLHKPEISVILTVATLPFLPTMVICGEIILTLFAYVLKVLRGKRSFKLDLLDIFVFVFLIFMFLGGVFSVTPSSSLPPACVFICFLSAYFLIVNLIKTKELVSKLLGSSIFSFALCSLYGIYQNFFAAPDTTWTDEDMFSEIETRVVSTFENPNVFGEYLIMLIPVALAMIIVVKGFTGKFMNFVSLSLALLALVYTWSRGAWIGCIASMIIFFVIINKRALGAYFMGVLAVPLAIPMLPTSIIERFSSIGNMTDTSTSYRVFIWEASSNMIKDYLLSGIGIGTDAFQTVYSEYALAGIETAPHSHNLYLQVLIEQGIFGFAVFLFTIFLFYSKVFTFFGRSSNREAKLIVGALACGILAILLQGLTDYVWYNYRVFAFFWMMLAAAVTAVNIYSQEDETEESLNMR